MSKASAVERSLHARLTERDSTAPAELADAYLDRVIKGLRRRCQDVTDEALITEAAIDAVLNYAERPSQYDPDRLGLLSFLIMSAKGDLLNALKQETRHAARFAPFSVVAEREEGRNSLQRHLEQPVQDEYDLGDRSPAPDLCALVRREFSDPLDLRLVDLLVSGERRTSAFAEVLGIQDHDRVEQERIVKRHKDRLRKRLQRLGSRYSG